LIALNFVLRCRSAYKLKEIIEEHKIIEEGARVLDLGCAPGSWCQVLFENIFPKSKYDQQIGEGKIVGVDVIKILPLDGVHLIFGDFTKVETQKEIVKSFVIDGKLEKIDAVVSDAAPNASGFRSQDAAKLSNIVNSSSKIALNVSLERFKVMNYLTDFKLASVT